MPIRAARTFVQPMPEAKKIRVAISTTAVAASPSNVEPSGCVRQPIQDRCIAGIAQADFKHDAQDTERQRVKRRVATREKLKCRTHCAKISPQVDDICNEQQCNDRPQQRAWVVPPQIARDPGTGDATDLRRNLLDGDHQRKAEHKRPSQAVTELRADLTVRADAAWVVVSGTRDQSWTKAVKELARAVGRGDRPCFR